MSKDRKLSYKDGTPYPFADGSVDSGSKLNMSQQTAVDWLESKVLYIVPSSQKDDLLKLFQQAKEMEKNQIMNACKEFDQFNISQDWEQYYNETYKKF
jgi:hypothetical protein